MGRPRNTSRLAVACVLLLCAVGCVTVKVAAIPPPEREIATEEDMERVGSLLPDPKRLTAGEVMDWTAFLERLTESVSYAIMAEKRLAEGLCEVRLENVGVGLEAPGPAVSGQTHVSEGQALVLPIERVQVFELDETPVEP